ncbi:MAG TPA: methyltransferase domain-containing protein [Phycisphaerales bacterium]|nr:methyltransferase domain-containing protein [Phycisphaerales bacterium]
MSSEPVLSILVPNFNNGRQSSKNGDRDFLGDLFQSLMVTLESDPTPIEVLVHDDGSNDDSLETCRAWATKTWRGGQKFCTLTEGIHTGVLSVVANKLTKAARGQYCVRLDGDIICLTNHWARHLVQVFESLPRSFGIVGTKQLSVNGHVHCAGQWILHPRGHQNLWSGAARHAVQKSIEVDDVMGCFYAHRRKVWEDVGGYDEAMLRGQTEDFSLMARLRGWRVISVPTIEFIHAHSERKDRATEADSAQGIEQSLHVFRKKWGFSRLAPDLDDIAEKYAGTPLLWNASVFGPRMKWPRISASMPDVRQTEWGAFVNDEKFRAAIQQRLAFILESLRKFTLPGAGPVVHFFSRSGLMCHLLAERGYQCVGVDIDLNLCGLAAQATSGQRYAVETPIFGAMTDHVSVPLPDHSASAVLVMDVLENHHNPVRVLREACRVVRKNGLVIIIAKARPTPFDAEGDPVHAYRAHELRIQVLGTRWFRVKDTNDLPTIAGTHTLLASPVAKIHQSSVSEVGESELADALVAT